MSLKQTTLPARKGRLVIARKHEQSVSIGEDIRVTVIHQNGQVRLAIEAPLDTHILREELEKR
jgi:carbon storage regulator CsrA